MQKDSWEKHLNGGILLFYIENNELLHLPKVLAKLPEVDSVNMLSLHVRVHKTRSLDSSKYYNVKLEAAVRIATLPLLC